MASVYVGVVNNKIIAFHDDKKVMSTYLKNYKETNPLDIVTLCKMKKKEAKKNLHYNQYWLVACNETYVQTQYEHILSMNSEYYDKVNLLDRLSKLLSKTKKKKDRAVLIDTMKIIEINKKRCGMYTPSLNILNEEYWRYEEYRNHTSLYM